MFGVVKGRADKGTLIVVAEGVNLLHHRGGTGIVHVKHGEVIAVTGGGSGAGAVVHDVDIIVVVGQKPELILRVGFGVTVQVLVCALGIGVEAVQGLGAVQHLGVEVVGAAVIVLEQVLVEVHAADAAYGVD